MLNTQRNLPTDDDKDRAERIRKIIEALIEANKKFPVIVEGKKDADALKKLGLTGKIITLHNGRNLYDFSENILENYEKVIVLLDWDAKGESLYRSLTENLTGRWEGFSAFRELVKVLCRKDIKDIEGLPKLLSRLEGPDGPQGNEYSR
jgi:5S rRNA maturation endonuclease (ribonuclease M5)